MNRPFKSIDDQIDSLKKRGMVIFDHDEARRVLLGTNYYSIINGYKDSFTVHTASGERFKDGTTLAHMQILYSVDEAFREITLSSLLRAESIMKSTLVHAFCEEYGGGDSYLRDDWYRPKSIYQKKRAYYESNRSKLESTLKKRRSNDRNKDYIQHYIDAYGNVPLWVLAQTLSFGDVSLLFDFQMDKVQNRMCAFVCEVSGKRFISPSRMKEAFNVLTQFRNVCAHGERFYCARVGKRGNWNFADLVKMMPVVLTEEEVARYARRMKGIISSLEDDKEIKAIVLDGLGAGAELLGAFAAEPRP